jgi:hypothetical protein
VQALSPCGGDGDVDLRVAVWMGGNAAIQARLLCTVQTAVQRFSGRVKSHENPCLVGGAGVSVIVQRGMLIS